MAIVNRNFPCFKPLCSLRLCGDKQSGLNLQIGCCILRSGFDVDLDSRVVHFLLHRLDPTADLLVLVDDIALSCGMIRLRSCSGAGGHNGLADIQEKLSTSDYARLRIGIDSPQHIPQREYVLGRFRPDQLQLIEAALEEAVDAAACWLLHGIVATMNRFNRRQTA